MTDDDVEEPDFTGEQIADATLILHAAAAMTDNRAVSDLLDFIEFACTASVYAHDAGRPAPDLPTTVATWIGAPAERRPVRRRWRRKVRGRKAWPT